MDSKGCLLERGKYNIDCRDIPLGIIEEVKTPNYVWWLLGISLEMHPHWLRCFSWKSHLFFFSLKSGRVIFKHQTGEAEL